MWRSDGVYTSIVDNSSRFALLSFASSNRLASLLDSSRRSGRLTRSFGRGGRGFAGSDRVSVGLSDLAKLLQVLLDSARSTSDLVGGKLQRC